MKTLNISLISGAHRNGSRSALVARYLTELIGSADAVAQVHLIDVSDSRIPIYEEHGHLTSEQSAHIESIRSTLALSDSLVLVSPEYNGGMAGSLKNLLDFYRKEYERKPMGLVSVSSGSMGGINALHQMIEFASYVGAFILNKRLMVSEVDKAFDPMGGMISERLERNARAFTSDLIWLTQAVSHQKALDLHAQN